MTFETVIIDNEIGEPADWDTFTAEFPANEYLVVYRAKDPRRIKAIRDSITDKPVVAVVDPALFDDEEMRAEHINHLIDIGVDAIEFVFDRGGAGFMALRDICSYVPADFSFGVQYPIDTNRDWLELKRSALVASRLGPSYFRPVIGGEDGAMFNRLSCAAEIRKLQRLGRCEVRLSPRVSNMAFGGDESRGVIKFITDMEQDLLFVW